MLKLSGVTLHGKTDTPGFNPCELLPRFAAFTGRKERTEEQIQKMVDSLLLHGQEQNFTFRKSSFDKGPIPVTGHTRIIAAARITSQSMKATRFYSDGTAYEVQYSPEKPFILKGDFRDMNETEAMIHTFIENDGDSRTALNDVDVALFIRTISETTGKNDTEIAKLLGKPASWISTHRAVLSLDSDTQHELATGGIAFASVATIAAVPPSERKAVIAKAKKNGKKATGTALKNAVADLGVTVAKPLAHTDSEFKKWYQSKIESTPAGPAQAFLFAIHDFRSGVGSVADLDEKFAALSGESLKAFFAA